MLDGSDTVLDVGANVGFYSRLAASVESTCSLSSRHGETRSSCFAILSRMASKILRFFRLVLQNSAGSGRIYGFGGISSFVAGWGQAQTSRYSLVPVTTLDALVAKRFEGKRSLIKVEVEGFELDVLAGATETLQLDPKPIWMVEVLLRDGVIPGEINTRFQETFEMFWRLGYQCTKLDKTPSRVQRSDVEHWVGRRGADCTNFLFSSRYTKYKWQRRKKFL